MVEGVKCAIFSSELQRLEEVLEVVGGVILLVGLQIVETQQDLPEQVLGFAFLETAVVGFMVVDGKVGRECKFSKERIALARPIVLPSCLVLLIAKEIDISAHHLYPLYPFHDLLIRLRDLFAGVFDHLDKPLQIGHAYADAIALDILQLFHPDVVPTLQAALHFLAQLIDRVAIDFDDLIDVVGDAELQVGGELGKLLGDDRVDVLVVVLDDALYDEGDQVQVLLEVG